MNKDNDGKNWGASFSVWQSKKSIEYLFDRMRSKGAISNNLVPTMVYGYVVDSFPPMALFNTLSNIFRFSSVEEPEKNIIRLKLLMCLSLALKCHTFLFEQEKVKHEPFFYIFPSTQDINVLEVGLLYVLENNKIIFITTSDTFEKLKENANVTVFNGVVSKNTTYWYSVQFWKNSVKATVERELKQDNISLNPWSKEGSMLISQRARLAKTEDDLKKYAIPLAINKDLKDYFKPLGTMWNPNINTWFLPKGFEISSVKEYISYIEAQKK